MRKSRIRKVNRMYKKRLVNDKSQRVDKPIGTLAEFEKESYIFFYL